MIISLRELHYNTTTLVYGRNVYIRCTGRNIINIELSDTKKLKQNNKNHHKEYAEYCVGMVLYNLSNDIFLLLPSNDPEKYIGYLQPISKQTQNNTEYIMKLIKNKELIKEIGNYELIKSILEL